VAAVAGSEYVAECFWPGVSESDLRALDERAATAAQQRGGRGRQVRYLGSLLFQEDEVVMCMFAGEEPAVREVAVAASIPFDRIIASARSPRALAAKGGVGTR
jgi:hypothetical protein